MRFCKETGAAGLLGSIGHGESTAIRHKQHDDYQLLARSKSKARPETGIGAGLGSDRTWRWQPGGQGRRVRDRLVLTVGLAVESQGGAGRPNLHPPLL